MVAVSADRSEVLARVGWEFDGDGGCLLMLDDDAQAVLRSGVSVASQLVWGFSPPDLSLEEPSGADRAAAEYCHKTRSPFALEPVAVAWSEDASRVLAQVRWQRNDVIGCYLVLNDNALAALEAAHETGPGGLVAGRQHSCLLRADRTLACWGNKDWHIAANPPTGRFIAVDTGAYHSCAITTDRALACWAHGSVRYEPVASPDGQFASVAVGDRHSCAIGVDGVVLCWGDDRLGKTNAPDGQFTAVAAGVQHSCAIGVDGAVSCWGDDSFGQASPPEGRFIAVAAGDYHSCAIRADQSLACWGQGHRPGEQKGPPAGEFTAVSAGAWHSCAIRADRTVACWGRANLGYGQADPPAGQFISVAAGAQHSCGVRVDRTVACWGSGENVGKSWSPFISLAPIQAVYAIPAGVEPVAGREQQIADAVAEVQQWFRVQTGGHHPLFAQTSGRVSVAAVELSGPGASYSAVLGEIHEHLGAAIPLAVFGEGEFLAPNHPSVCAGGAWPSVMISLARCARDYPNLPELVAHELVHFLGAAEICAPNYESGGHVDDDRRDILFHHYIDIRLSRLVLDAGRDDYYGHGHRDCYDIADNPLLAYPGPEPRPEAPPAPAPGKSPQPRVDLHPSLFWAVQGYSREYKRWVNDGVWCTGVTSTSVSLEWLDLGGVIRTEVSYGRSHDAGAGTFDASELRGATATTATVDGLYSATSYAFRVVTYGADGEKLDGFHTRCSTRNLEFMRCPQTHTAQTSLRLAWDHLPGAEGYAVAHYDDHGTGKDVFGAFTTGTSLEVGGLEPGTRYRFLLFPLHSITAADPDSLLAGRVFSDWFEVRDIAKQAAQIIDVSDIPGFPDRIPPYGISCQTLLPGIPRSRCVDVGPTSLTLEWDPGPRVSIYKVWIDDGLHNRTNNHYWTTHTSWTFDGLIAGRTYQMGARGYPKAHLDPRHAIAPGRWITDHRVTTLQEVVGVDDFIWHSGYPYLHCQTQGPQ